MKIKMNIRYLYLLFFILGLNISNGQDLDSLKKDTSNQVPFRIADIKKLDSLELANKREGTYVTGLPDISVDPINGFGYGAEGSIIFNGKRSNPFFEYTPYLAEIDLTLFNTTRQQREFILGFDIPYVFRTKWRLRGELGYESNPNLLYFGITDNTLNKLNTLSQQDNIPNPPFTGTRYKDYENSLSGNNVFYNTYLKQEYIINLSGEYSLFDSKMRVLIGGEAAGLNLTTPRDSASRLQQDGSNINLPGVGRSLVTFLQVGVVYDTRDFEPDPNRGIFAEITNEFSNKILGSAFNLNKIFGQIKFYKRLFPKHLKKFVYATRFGIGYTFGNAPFFEYQDEWSSEGSIEGLGGSNTLRGYKQSRFLDRGMYFFNTEFRYRFLGFRLFKQDFAFSAVPFFDVGSVYKNLNNAFAFNRMRYSYGLGLRISWNLSTILRFDYALSQEDGQFFFTFGHAF